MHQKQRSKRGQSCNSFQVLIKLLKIIMDENFTIGEQALEIELRYLR